LKVSINISTMWNKSKSLSSLPYEWSIETGELTPKMSLKRKVVMEKYRDAIERIYD
jgi:long-chain acyl-CoA synthetase